MGMWMFSAGMAQSSLNFEGVYYVEQPALLLVLQRNSVGYTGYLSDGQQLIPISGKTGEDQVLTLEASINGVVNKSYASRDAGGNLVMTDEQLNIVYFIRSAESVQEVMAGIRKALAGEQPAATTTATRSAAAATGKADSRFAGKKLLHLYTGNGMSEKWAYYLLADGHFAFRSQTSYLSGNAFSDFSAAAASSEGGTWSVQREGSAEYLFLNWNSGEKGKLQLKQTDGGYLLNNTRYFLVGLNEYE